MELNDQAIVTLTATGAKHLNDFMDIMRKIPFSGLENGL